MTIRVNAFGKTIAFPAGTPPEDIEKHITSNRALLDPDYKEPEKGFLDKAGDFGKDFIQNSLGVDMGVDSTPAGVTGLLNSVSRGARQTGRMVGSTVDTVRGNLPGVEQYGEASQQAFENEAPVEQKQLTQELSNIDRDQSVTGQIGDTLSAAGRNKMGTAQLVAEQLPNTAVSLGGGYAGAKTGAAIGSLAGPVGAGAGGILGFLGGMFLGNVLLETGGKAIEKSEGGFTPEERDETLREGPIKAGVITGVDAATLGIGGKVTKALSGIAKRAGARAEAKVLMDAGVNMATPATINSALSANPALMRAAKVAGEKAALGSLSASRKAGIAGTGLALETVGEGVGEYLGEYAATGEPDVVDATIESLAGMSQSMIETAYNYNKIGTQATEQDVAKAASDINAERTQQGIDNIATSGSVDEAIQAANDTVSQKPVTSSDVWDDVNARNELLQRAEQINQPIGAQNEAQIASTEAPAAQASILNQQITPESTETGLNQSVMGNDVISNPLQAQQEDNVLESNIIAQNLGNAPKGKKTEVILPDNTSLPAEWMVVDADSITASLKNGVNQPRDRTRAVSDIQIQNIAANPDYRRLSDSPVMNVGAPTISADGSIVGGNGRFEGISRAYSQGTADEFLRNLTNDAVNKGIDPATFAGMKKPVLVKRITQPFDARKLAVASNSGGSLQYSALELARIDSDRITDIDRIEVSDNGDIALTQNNIANLKKSLRDYGSTELAAFVDKDGNLSQEGMKRVKNAILYSAYGDSPTLSRMVESTDNDMRNVVGALTKVAGDVAKVRSNIKNGAIPKELDITDNLIEAVEKISQLRSTGMSVDQFMSQQAIFDDIDNTGESKQIMQMLSDTMRSQKKMAEFLRNVYDGISRINITTDNVFGDTSLPTKSEIIENAKPKEQAGIFGADNETSQADEQESATKTDNVKSSEESKLSRSPTERLRDRDASIRLERALKNQGFKFRITPKDVRDFAAMDRGRQDEAVTAERLAGIFKKRITWIEADGDFDINGVMLPSIKDTIFVDVNTDKSAHVVIGHELSHHMEQEYPEVYQAMVDALTEIIPSTTEYAKKYGIKGADDAYIIKEIVGDIVGDNFTDQKFWNKVAAYNPNAFQRIADTVISWLKKLVANSKLRKLGSEQWVTDAHKAQDIVARAVSQYTNKESTDTTGDIKFSFAGQKSQTAEVMDNAPAPANSVSNKLSNAANKSKDKEYLSAIESGDLEKAQKMVDAAAREKGYISGNEYRMQHRAPNREDYNLATIKESGIVPDDYWTHPHYYQSSTSEMMSFDRINAAIDRQKRTGRKAGLTVYRAVPKDVKDYNIRNGDWVSPSREYARQEGESIPGGYRIISSVPNIENLWWDANSINELGYDDGKEYAYKNTKNNRKLIDTITYDDNGDIIPLSKRFNQRSDDIRFSRAESVSRKSGYPETAKEPLYEFNSAERLKLHKEYKRAKSGNIESAVKLARDLVSERNLAEAKKRFGSDVAYIPVILKESEGTNRIPHAVAALYANNSNAEIETGVFEKQKAFHTGMNMMERLISRASFSGEIVKGKRYVIVDDVTTSGATLSDLTSYIQENGGEVAGSVLLTNAIRGGSIFPLPKTINRLESQHGDSIREIFGIEPSALTKAESQYLLGFRTDDEIRRRADKARNSRRERLLAKDVPKSEDTLKFSRSDTPSQEDVEEARSLGYIGTDRYGAKAWIEAYKKGLSMSKDARMERSKEMGFNTKKIGYHGSAKKFNKFDLSYSGDGEGGFGYGYGVSVATDMATASSYGKNIHKVGIIPKESSFLKWDSPLNKQSAYIKRIIEDNEVYDFAEDIEGVNTFAVSETEETGEDLYSRIYDKFNTDDKGKKIEAGWITTGAADKKASEYLLSIGIHGIKYKDNVDNSYNYTIFSTDDVVIINSDDEIKFSRSDTLSQAGVNTEETDKPSTLPEETKLQAFRRRSQDAMLRFKVMQNWLDEQGVKLSEAANVYQRENISKGKQANKIEDFRRDQLEPLIKRIAEASKAADKEGKFTLGDVATYLEAVHIPEANERMRTIHNDENATANGITDEQARKVLKQFESMTNFREFKKLAEEVRKIGTETLDMRLEAGLISQDQYDAYKATYNNWVPLRGNMSKQGFGKGLSTNAKDKRRMGHGFREDEFVLENLVQDRERAIMQIEKNKVGLSVAQFIMEAQNENIGTVDKPEKMRVMKDFSYAVKFNGDVVGSFETQSAAKAMVQRIIDKKEKILDGKSFTSTDFSVEKTYDPHITMMARPQLSDNEIQVYVNGHAVKLQLNDPGLARAATNAGIEQVGSIAHAARMFNRFLSKAYTAWSPDFLFMNMARDAYSGTLVLTGKKGAKFAAKTFTNYGAAIRELIKGRNDPKRSEWVSRYRAAGGNIGAAYLSDIERVGEDAMAALQEFAGARETYRMVYNEQISKGAKPVKARTMAVLKAGVAKTKTAPVVGKMFQTLERINTVIENALRLATFKTAVESGESDQQAATLSKDLMNFNRKGEVANQMGALYLFYNPGMQGAHIVGEALFTSPHRKQVWSLLGALTTLSFVLAELARGDDDDREWENTPDYIKDRNLIFNFGDKQVTVPVAYGFGIFHAMGNYLSDLNHGADKSEIALKLASGAFENFSVFGNPILENDEGNEIRLDQLLPTFPKIIMAPGINLDSLGRQIHPTKYQDSVPDSQLMWRSVRGTAYEDIAHFMNGITGGSEYNPGAIDISPNTIKYWVTSLTGGAGRFVSDITTGSLNAAEGVGPEIDNVPVLRKFIREPGVNDSRGAFHKARKEAQSAAERAGKALRNGDMPEYTKMMSELQPIIEIAKYARDAQKMASMARDEVMRIQLDTDMSKAEKKLRIKEIELQEQRVYDQFLSAFDVAKGVIKKN